MIGDDAEHGHDRDDFENRHPVATGAWGTTARRAVRRPGKVQHAMVLELPERLRSTRCGNSFPGGKVPNCRRIPPQAPSGTRFFNCHARGQGSYCDHWGWKTGPRERNGQVLRYLRLVPGMPAAPLSAMFSCLPARMILECVFSVCQYWQDECNESIFPMRWLNGSGRSSFSRGHGLRRLLLLSLRPVPRERDLFAAGKPRPVPLPCGGLLSAYPLLLRLCDRSQLPTPRLWADRGARRHASGFWCGCGWDAHGTDGPA